MDQEPGSVPIEEFSGRASAISLMLEALFLLDRHGPALAAATLSMAIEQAGGSPPEME